MSLLEKMMGLQEENDTSTVKRNMVFSLDRKRFKSETGKSWDSKMMMMKKKKSWTRYEW